MRLIDCSIIIPMFNEQNSLDNCFKNLVNQTSKNFEVIFINDGSTDSTAEKLEGLLVANELNYKVIHQKNKGAAAARQAGIHEASSDYIVILDCDDGISANAIEKAVESMRKTNADISMFQLYFVDTNGKKDKFVLFEEKESYTGNECLINSLGEWKAHGFALYKKSIFLKSYALYNKYNKNDENYINNDEVLTRLNFFHAKKVVTNDGNYYYKYNPNSTTKRINQNMYLILNNAIIMHDLFADKKDSNADKELFNTLYKSIRYYVSNSDCINNKLDWNNAIRASTKELFKRGVFWKLAFRQKIKFLKRLYKALRIKYK